MFRSHLGILFFCICGLAAGMETAGQSNTQAGPTEKIAAQRKSVEANPTDGAAWERLGSAYHQAANYADAVRSFQKALDNGFSAAVGEYNLACASARNGNKAQALTALAAAIAAGFHGPFATDPDFATIADDPQFRKLSDSVPKLQSPCADGKTNPEFRQLDFWVGEWDVFAGPQKVGESKVQLILGDCVVFENWKGAFGDQGKSFNKYNPASRKWEQFWVSDDGTTNYFSGHLVGSQMRYSLAKPAGRGAVLMRHLTFSRLAADKVRQFSESSLNRGKTWTTDYDFTYVRTK